MRYINHKSDFKFVHPLNEGDTIPVFSLTFYVKGNSDRFVASYDGREYKNCRLEDGCVVVAIDNSDGRLGVGRLRCAVKYSFSDADFKDGRYNFTSDDETDVELHYGATDDLGDMIMLYLPGYQKGDKGDPFTYEDFTPEQLEALKGKNGKDGRDGIDGKDGRDGIDGKDGKDGIDGKDGKDGSDASVVLSTHSALFHDDSESSKPIAIRLSSGLGEYEESVDAFLGNEGLYISSNRSLGILLSSESGLEIGTNASVDGKTCDSGRGLSVKVGTGLMRDNDGVKIKLGTDGSIAATSEGGVRVGTLSIGTDESKRPHILLGTGLETTGNRNIFIDSKKLIGTSNEAMYQVSEDAISPKQGYGYKLRTGVRLSTMRDMDDYIDAHSIVLGSAIILNNGDVPEIGVYYDNSFVADDYNRLKIANNGVQSQHIAPNAVGENHIQAGSINEYALQRYSVTSETLRNGSVIEDKLSEEVKEKLNKSSEFSGSASDVTYEGDLEANNVQEAIEELNTKKVDREDNAPKLTAGFANNLVGRGEATEEVIGFRPSGGETSIEDGTARIERLKGNTVVWNQYREDNNTEFSLDGIKTSYDSATHLICIENVSRTTNLISGSNQIVVTKNDITYGHKFISIASIGNEKGIMISQVGYGNDVIYGINEIFTAKHTKGVSIQIRVTYEYDFVNKHPIGNKYYFYFNIFDLTQMFGAGNEPTTIEEFNARKPLNIDEYAYNEGELISTNVEAIKSVGFNAWDEEWEVGGFLEGVLQNDSDYNNTIRNKNFIRVISGGTYRFEYGGSVYVNYFDRNKKYISAKSVFDRSSFTVPENAVYIWFRPGGNTYGTTYNHDICLHLVHTGYRNGEYEPYEEFTRNITISGIKDSDGNQLFPNGLLSAGSVHDEITATKAIKRIGVVDMGTINWRYALYNENKYQFRAYLNHIKDAATQQTLGNIVTSKYSNVLPFTFFIGYTAEDKTISKWISDGALGVQDSSYTDAVTFKAAMSGVMLYYELAEPIEVDLPEPLNLDYEVSDFGTEEVISDAPTTPLKADIIYQFNAVDRIRDNSRHTAEAEVTLDNLQKGQLNLSVKDNGNIVLSNANGESKEFMPATPSGDPMHYAYIGAGAEWNDTDSDIIKTITIPSWSTYGEWITEDVVHKAKCYRIGTCGNLTSSDMTVIYNDAKWWLFDNYAGTSPVGRHLLLPKVYTEYYCKTYSLSQSFNNNKVMQDLWLRHLAVVNENLQIAAKISDINFLGQGSVFKRIIGVIDFSMVTSTKSFNPVNLEYVNIIKLKNSLNIKWSPNISKDSVKYMIDNAIPTTALTITLHPDAYTRLVDDVDIVAALETKNTALQGTGGSISLVSA